MKLPSKAKGYFDDDDDDDETPMNQFTQPSSATQDDDYDPLDAFMCAAKCP